MLLGARALDMDKEIGTSEVGEAADLIAVRIDTPRMTPLLTGQYSNIPDNLAHAVQGDDVDLTVVAGCILVDNGQLQSADQRALINHANTSVPHFFGRCERRLAQHNVTKELERNTICS